MTLNPFLAVIRRRMSALRARVNGFERAGTEKVGPPASGLREPSAWAEALVLAGQEVEAQFLWTIQR